MADFVTDFVADGVTDFGIFLSFKSVGKSFGGTYALHLFPLSAWITCKAAILFNIKFHKGE